MTDEGGGRLELVWPGKYSADGQRARVLRRHPTLQVVERHEATPTEHTPEGRSNQLVLADNLLALDALVDELEEAVDLIYLDPPFATGQTFDVVVPTGARKGGSELRLPAYRDRWPGGAAGFLRMLDPRLRLMHRLLAPHGSLYVHVDPTVGHAVKLMLDDVFGPECFQREIVWRIGWISGFKSRARNWIRNHDLIFFYVKDPRRFTFNKIHVPHPPGYRRREGAPARAPGIPVDDVWNAGSAELALKGAQSLDSIQIKSFSGEKTGYATQKNESLLERIIFASSNPGELVLDPFCGSGTTLAVAQRLGRRWIGIDASTLAVHIARKRLLASKAPPPFSVVVCASDERRIWLQARGDSDGPRARGALARRWGGREDPAPGLHRAQGARALWMGADQPITQADIEAAMLAAQRGGFAALDVIGWEFAHAFPLPTAAAGVDVTLLQITRDIFDDAATARSGAEAGEGPLPWLERPHVEVAFDGLTSGEVSVRLQGYRYPHPDRLPVEVGPAMAQWDDWIDGWMLDWGGAESTPFCARTGSYRSNRERSLSLSLGPWDQVGSGPVLVRARVVDVLGNSTDVVASLTRDDGTWRVQGLHSR